MADILSAEVQGDRFTIIHQVKDDSKKRELRQEDDHEDFLDEGGSVWCCWIPTSNEHPFVFTLYM
jgi:hypothetical protein